MRLASPARAGQRDAGRPPPEPLERLAADHADLRLDPCPTDVTIEAEVRTLFDQAVTRHGRVDLLFNNAGMGSPPHELDEIPLAEWQAVVDLNLTGAFLCTAEAFRVMKASAAARRADHQQRLDLGARPPAAVDRLHRDQARDHRADQGDRAGRARVRHRLRSDRHRQRRDRHDGGDGRGSAAGRRQLAPEPRMHVDDVARAVVYMASLPLDANVATMTVMATKMPSPSPIQLSVFQQTPAALLTAATGPARAGV